MRSTGIAPSEFELSAHEVFLELSNRSSTWSLVTLREAHFNDSTMLLRCSRRLSILSSQLLVIAWSFWPRVQVLRGPSRFGDRAFNLLVQTSVAWSRVRVFKLWPARGLLFPCMVCAARLSSLRTRTTAKIGAIPPHHWYWVGIWGGGVDSDTGAHRGAVIGVAGLPVHRECRIRRQPHPPALSCPCLLSLLVQAAQEPPAAGASPVPGAGPRTQVRDPAAAGEQLPWQ